MKFKSDIEAQAGFKDAGGDLGVAGQLLSSTGTETNWIDQSTIASGSAEVVEVPVKNLQGSALTKGDPVYISGSVGASGILEVQLADAGNAAKMPAVGLLKQDLAANAQGFAVVTGKLRNLITSPIDGVTPNPNTVVYVKSGGSTGAALTTVKPGGSTNLIQNMGKVGRVSASSDGTLVVSSILRSNDVPNLPLGRLFVGTNTNTSLTSDVVYIDDANDRVGIGTTSPSAVLDVNGAGNFSGGTVVSGIDTSTNVGVAIARGDYLYSNDGSYLRNIIGHSSTGSIDIGQPGTGLITDIKFFPGSSGNILFYASGSENMRVASSGNVGIGTTSPTTRLDLGTSNTIGTGLGFGSTSSELRRGNSGNNVQLSHWANLSMIIDSDNNDTTRYFNVMHGANDSSTATELFRVQEDGNVGIGTTSPAGRLHVSDTATLTAVYQKFTNGTTGHTSNDGTTLGIDSDGDFLINNNEAKEIKLYTSDTQRLTISSAGAIQFNSYNSTNQTGTPTYLLGTDASGNIVKTNTVPGSAAGPYLPLAGGTMTGTNGVLFPDNFKLKFGDATTPDLEIYHDGSNSYIKETGTGRLVLSGGSDIQLQSPAGEVMADLNGNGSVDLYYDNSKKFETTSTGVTVTGAATATTFLGDLNGTINTVTTAVTKANNTNDTTVATTAFVQNLIGTIPAGLVFQGTWNADTNTPTLTSGTGTTGNFYIVSVDGSTNLDGITDWKVGDWAVFVEQGASDQWEKVDNSSVLDGSGTGQTVALWSGSGTSNTLTDAPITVSGNNATFAGNVLLSGYLSVTSNNIGTGATRWIGADGTTSTWFYNVPTGGNHYFAVNNTNQLSINENNAFFTGNVGIGGSPISKFTVIGTDNTNQANIGHSTQSVFIKVNGTNVDYNSSGDSGGSHTFSTGNTERMRIDSAGKVSVGSPVVGQLGVRGTTNDSTAYSFESANLSGATLFAVRNDGLSFFPYGNVGIGTTTPIHKLDVNGIIVSNSSNPQLRMLSAANQTNYLVFGDAQDDDVGYIFYQHSDDTLGFRVNASERMRITSSGNVGIGTTSPGNTLSIAGGNPTTTTLGTNFGQFGIFNAGDQYGIQQWVTGSGDGHIQVGRIDGSATAYDLILQELGGNVGIGTTSPNALLHVYSSGNGEIEVERASGALFNIQSQASLAAIGTDSNHPLYLKTNGGTRVAITTAGDVGIGTTSPGFKLDLNNPSVSGTSLRIKSINAQLQIESNTAGDASIYFLPNSLGSQSAAFRVTDGYNFAFRNATGTEYLTIKTASGRVGVNQSSPAYELDVTGTIRATGNVIAFSDARVKENIKTIDSALEKVNKLRGVEFNKIGEEKTCIGVIAQEVEEVLPEVVETDDNGMKAVAYGNMVGLLIEAMKEQQKQIDELKAKLESYGS
jgi:hypothetical protein